MAMFIKFFQVLHVGNIITVTTIRSEVHSYSLPGNSALHRGLSQPAIVLLHFFPLERRTRHNSRNELNLFLMIHPRLNPATRLKTPHIELTFLQAMYFIFFSQSAAAFSPSAEQNGHSTVYTNNRKQLNGPVHDPLTTH